MLNQAHSCYRHKFKYIEMLKCKFGLSSTDMIVACQVSLSCSSIINALYLVLFDTINTVPDITIVKILQITSVASSIVYFSGQALFKVRIYEKALVANGEKKSIERVIYNFYWFMICF